MKKLFLILVSALAGASLLPGQPCASEADAKSAADKLYVKGGTFTETFEKTRPQYAKWAEEQKKLLSSDVVFSPWRASVNLKAFPGKIADALNPIKTPVDENAVYEVKSEHRHFKKSGAYLMNRGIDVVYYKPLESEIFIFKRIK